MNRELRRFFPKRTDLSAVRQTEVDVATAWLNNRPRRSLSTARRTKPSRNSSTLFFSRFNVRAANLTLMKKSVKSAHAISPEESIRLRFFDRRREDTCM